MPSDPARLTLQLRAATHAEPVSLLDGRRFPAQSGAVFTVAVSDAAGRPVRFRPPVHITVQLKQRPKPEETDAVRFDGSLARAQEMGVVRDMYEGEAVSFDFVSPLPPEADFAAGTVTCRNVSPLTHYDGTGTFGAVGRPLSTRAARWPLYRP